MKKVGIILATALLIILGKCSADLEALPKIIKGLKDNSYRFLTITELITIQDGKDN